MQPDLVRITEGLILHLCIYVYMYVYSICQEDGTLDCEKQKEDNCNSKEENGNYHSIEKKR